MTAADFNGVARWYRWLEYAMFGRGLERCRFALLPELANAQRVLVLGEGDGRFLARLLAAQSEVEVVCVEASEAMVSRAKGQLRPKWQPRVEFVVADARTWNFPTQAFDAVVTCFFLDCFGPETLAGLMPCITGSIRPNGRWLVAEFHQPRRGFAAWRAKFWLKIMYAFFGRTKKNSYLRVCV